MLLPGSWVEWVMHYDLSSRALASLPAKGEGVTWLLSGPLARADLPSHPRAGPACAPQPEPGPCVAGCVPLPPEPRLASCLCPCIPRRRTVIPDSLQDPAWGGEKAPLTLPEVLAHLPEVVGGRWKLTS